MLQSKIVDTFPSFLSYWGKAQNLSVDEQIQLWKSEYLAPYPELLQKQIQDYADNGDDWHQVAKTKVVPFWQERLPVGAPAL